MHFIGDSLFLLLRQFYPNDIPFTELTSKVFNLCYLSLSNNIYNYPNISCDSHTKRGLLLRKGSLGLGTLTLGLVQGSIGMSTNTTPLIINDFYSSGNIYISLKMSAQGQKLIERAREFHTNLEDLTINGKDVSDYTLSEISEIGRLRHENIYTLLLKKFSNKDFFMTQDEFHKLFN